VEDLSHGEDRLGRDYQVVAVESLVLYHRNMSKIKDFSNWVNEPAQTIRIHTYLGWFWIALAGAALVVGFIGSTVFIAVLSIVALSLSNWSAVQAVRTEIKQTQQMEQEDARLEREKKDKDGLDKGSSGPVD
jgi:hypothetical protein